MPSIPSKVLHAVIMGAPASGKGTISERIIKQFGFHHLACGDILRQNIQNGTELGRQASQYITRGQLVPDRLVVRCILDKLTEVPGQPMASWLLDGFPRTIGQADDLGAAERIDVVLNLVVPHDVIVARVQGRWVHLASGRVYNVDYNAPKEPFRDDVTGEPLVQRDDDKPLTVRKRLEVYESLTKPLIEYYGKQGRLASFEGRTSNEIWPKVQAFLQNKLTGA